MPENGTRLYEELMRFKPDGLTANGWAVKAGVSRAIWNDLRRHGNPSRRTLEKLLAAADTSLAEFEALRADGPPGPGGPHRSGLGEPGAGWRPAPLAPLPVVGTSTAGQWGAPGAQIEQMLVRRSEIVTQLPRPASLAADANAYAVTVIGDSMWPRFRPGRRVAVSPAAPTDIGDDVLVLFGSNDEQGQRGLLKELVRRSAASLELRQFNPEAGFEVPNDGIEAVQKVVGELF